jgi:ABC-type branched-subunit amino acid transport system ATPase component
VSDAPTPPPPPPLVVTDGLLASGPRGVVFGPVTLRVAAGEVVALVGPGGSGRTSLLLALAGRYALTGGRLEVAGARTPREIRDAVAVARADALLDLDEVWTVGEAVAQRAALARRPPARVAPPASVPLHTLGAVDRALLDVALAAGEGRRVVVMDDVDRGLGAEDEARVWRALGALGPEVAAIGVTTDAGPARAAGATVVPLGAGNGARA